MLINYTNYVVFNLKKWLFSVNKYSFQMLRKQHDYSQTVTDKFQTKDYIHLNNNVYA